MPDDSQKKIHVLAALAVVGAMALVATASAQTGEPSMELAPGATRVSGVDISLPTDAELQTVDIGPELRALVQQLDASSYDVREEAMGRFRSGACDKLHLYALLADPGLSVEQRHRLLTVLLERLLLAPRGAVGIRVNTARLRTEGIVIQDLLPGLPAERVLLVGDRLTRLNGDLLESWTEFVVAVQERPPGERVRLTVERYVQDAEGNPVVDENGQRRREAQEVELVLGSADELIDPMTGRPQSGGAVMNARRQEAVRATRRFGPRVQRIQIRGTSPTLAPPSATGGPVQ